MSQNIWGGGTIFARERSDRAGGGCGRGVSFFIFRLENVQSGTYLRRKFRLDDMYYMVACRDSTDREKVFFFKNAETYLWKYAPQNNLRKISNTCQRYSKYYITYNINMKEVPRRRNEGTKRTSMERMWCGGVSFQCSFLLLLMVWSYILKRQYIYTNKHVTLSKCMCMRASELRKFWHFHILKLLLFQYFVCTLKISHGLISFGGGGGKRPPPPPPKPPPVRQWSHENILIMKALLNESLNIWWKSDFTHYIYE